MFNVSKRDKYYQVTHHFLVEDYLSKNILCPLSIMLPTIFDGLLEERMLRLRLAYAWLVGGAGR